MFEERNSQESIGTATILGASLSSDSQLERFEMGEIYIRSWFLFSFLSSLMGYINWFIKDFY